MTITLNTPTGRRGRMIARNQAEHARMEAQRNDPGFQYEQALLRLERTLRTHADETHCRACRKFRPDLEQVQDETGQIWPNNRAHFCTPCVAALLSASQDQPSSAHAA